MAHPFVDNETPFAAALTFLLDGDLRTWAVVLLKATYDVLPAGGELAPCRLADEQPVVSLGGQLWGEDPAVSSYKDEPQLAWQKAATDVVLRGHAHPPHAQATRMEVSLAVGEVKKTVLVTGERVWFRSLGAISPTAPRPLEPTPLRYEETFGGWDRKDADPTAHTFEENNPVGTGFAARGSFVEGLRLPRVEDPRRPMRAWGDRPPPASFGFVSPSWPTRARHAGTYDQAWRQTRAPRLPRDLQAAFFNAASPELVARGHLRGNERVEAWGVTAEGRWAFDLPGASPPQVRVESRGRADRTLTCPGVDTIVLDSDTRNVALLWRYGTPLDESPHELRTVAITS